MLTRHHYRRRSGSALSLGFLQGSEEKAAAHAQSTSLERAVTLSKSMRFEKKKGGRDKRGAYLLVCSDCGCPCAWGVLHTRVARFILAVICARYLESDPQTANTFVRAVFLPLSFR